MKSATPKHGNPRLSVIGREGVRTQRQVADMLGLTRGVVAMTEIRAIRKLRRAWVAMYGPEEPAR